MRYNYLQTRQFTNHNIFYMIKPLTPHLLKIIDMWMKIVQLLQIAAIYYSSKSKKIGSCRTDRNVASTGYMTDLSICYTTGIWTVWVTRLNIWTV